MPLFFCRNNPLFNMMSDGLLFNMMSDGLLFNMISGAVSC